MNRASERHDVMQFICFFLLLKIVGCRLVASAIRTYSVHIILVTSRHIEEEETRKKAGKPERIAEEQVAR